MIVVAPALVAMASCAAISRMRIKFGVIEALIALLAAAWPSASIRMRVASALANSPCLIFASIC